MLGLVHYFTDTTIVSSLDEIILVLCSGYLLNDVMANRDPNSILLVLQHNSELLYRSTNSQQEETARPGVTSPYKCRMKLPSSHEP